MSILESAQHYKATIGPDHGGFTEIIGRGDNAIGLLFKPGDADALDKAITNLWDNSEECRSLGIAAHHKLVNEYSTEVISQKWDELIKSIINQKHK